MEILSIMMVAMMIEAVVEAMKPLWKADGNSLTAAEIVSILVGVLVAVTCRINMLAPFVKLNAPVWMEYIFYALTGIALGRGPSFVHDLWKNLKAWSEGELMEPAKLATGAMLAEEQIDLEITHWSHARLRAFCSLNSIPCAGCETREQYMDAIEEWCVAAPAEELKDPETPKYTDPDAYLMRETGNPPIDGAV